MRQRPWLLLLALLTLANLVYVWWFPYFVSQDGGAHLDTANTLLHWRDPAFSSYRYYYRLNLAPSPNWLIYPPLMALLAALPPAAAEKALVSLVLILWPLSLVWALRSVKRGGSGRSRRDASWAALLAMPLAVNWYLHIGFYSFAASIPLYLFFLGGWLRWRRGGQVHHLLLLAGLSLLLYFAHIVAVAEAWLTVAALLGWDWCVAKRKSRVVRSAAWSMVAALPTVALILWFFLRPGEALGAAGAFFTPELRRIKSFLFFDLPIVAFSSRENSGVAAYTILFYAALVVAAIARLRSLRRPRLRLADGLLVVAGIQCLLFLVAPDRIGVGAFLVNRLLIFPILTTILWVGSHRFAPAPRRIVCVASAGIALVLLSARLTPVKRLNDHYREYLSIFETIQPGEVVLPLPLTFFSVDSDESVLAMRSFPLLHAAGHEAVERRFLNLGNYQGQSDLFPLRWRSNRNPRFYIGPFNFPSDREFTLDILTYGERTGGRIDAIVVWADASPKPRDGRVESIREQLATGYRPIAVSKPRGYASLYRPVVE